MKEVVQKKIVSVYATYVFVGLLFIVSALVLIRVTLDIQRLRQSGTTPSRHGLTLRRHAASVQSPSYIDSWMTFGYINRVFNLPTTYLQQQLGIFDKKYPNVQLARYAKNQAIDATVFVAQVRLAVGRYQAGAVSQ